LLDLKAPAILGRGREIKKAEPFADPALVPTFYQVYKNSEKLLKKT
jgi:hypothetical protein